MKLSKREQEILVKVAYGLTDKEIAFDFGISIRTVQTHITSVMKKLQARNRANAVAIYCGIYPRWQAKKRKIYDEQNYYSLDCGKILPDRI